MEEQKIFHQNFEEDFRLRFRFPDERPTYPWRMVFSTSKYDKYIVSFDGKKYTHAKTDSNDANGIMIEFNAHRLLCGILNYTLYEDRPDEFYSDGIRRRALPVEMPFMLWDKPSDDAPMTPEFDVTMQVMRGYSAYEVAVREGFEGTAVEWLESLNGQPPTVDVIEEEAGGVWLRITDAKGTTETPNLRPLTYLVNLASAGYQAIAKQIVSDLSEGRAVTLFLRKDNQEPPQVLSCIRDASVAYLFATNLLVGTATDGIGEIEQVQYVLSKTTGNIIEMRNKVLSSILTTDAVQDDFDGESTTLPISQRQAAVLKRLIDELDGTTVKKDDKLILNGNGTTTK